MADFTRLELRALISRSELTITRFAEDVVGTDVRTVRRWLGGATIPPAQRDWLSRIVTLRAYPASVLITLHTKVGARLVRRSPSLQSRED
jgi:hypothetical protein